MADHGTLRPLRRPDFRKFWLGHGASALGSHLTGLALPLLVLDQTGSPILAGLVGTLRMLAYLLVHLPAGALADRIRRRAVVLAADAARALLVLPIGVALAVYQSIPISALLTLSVLGTLISSVADPAGQAATRHLVDREQLPAALALTAMRGRAVSLTAPLLGGLLYQIWPALPFLIDSLTFVLSFFLVASVRTQLGGGAATAKTTFISDIGAGIRFIGNSRFLVLLLAWAALGNFATAGITFALVLIVQPSGGGAVGTALAIVSLGGLIGASLAPHANRFRSRLLVPGITGIRLLIVWAVVAQPTPVVLAIGMAVIALLGPMASVPLNAYVFEVVPDHLMGRIQSSMTLVGGALYPFAALVTGLLAQQLSVQSALGFMALMFLIVFWLSLLRGLRMPDLAAPPARRSVDPVPSPG